MRRLHITQHLSVEELEQRQRQTDDPIERAHWHIIWLHAQGHQVKTIAQMTPYCSNWIYAILHRYDKDGPDGAGQSHLILHGTLLFDTKSTCGITV